MRFQYPETTRSKLALFLSASLTALTMTAVATPALATTEDAAEAAQDRPVGQLEDVVVTAERRPVDLQSSPLSVTAITADILAQGNITDITGLNGLVPGLVVARSGGGERMLAIRGIGSETPENTNTQPGVSYHVDGVYIFNSIAASAAFIDVAQVEVLRGPQGTMFGQGSTGGTINVVTNQPQLGRFGGATSLGLGNHDLVKSSASLNIPLGETFALRGAIQTYRHDGYAVATDVPGSPGFPLDEADDLGWRVAGLWAPTDDFSLTLSVISYESDTNGPAQKNILDPEPDPRRLTQDYPGRSIVDVDIYSAVFNWELPWATFKSITSYQELYSFQAWDADGLNASLFYDLTYSPLTWTGLHYDHVPIWESNTKSYTQEFNLTSNTDGPFQWVAGAVYLESENSQYIVEYQSALDPADPDIVGQLLRPALPRSAAYNDPGVAFVTYAELSAVTRKSWAAYFQGAYALTDQLTLTAGLRYNDDKYSGVSDNYSGGSSNQTSGAHLQPSPRQGLSTEELTGKLALDYQFTPTNLVYVSYTRGFKPGGLNSARTSTESWAASVSWAPPPTWQAIRTTYDPETVDAFEIGSKNRFFDNTLQLNASAFLYDYRNMQFLEEDPALFAEGTSNAPSAEIYGAEFEASWLITDKWRIDGSLSLLRGKFNEDYFALDVVAADAAQTSAGYPGYLYWSGMYDFPFFGPAYARDAARANINGNDVPKLPEVQGAISATYSDYLFGGYLTAKAEYLYRGKYQYRLFNESSTDIVPSYDQVNLFFRYEPDNYNWNASLTVTNLFDEDGLNSRFSDPYGSAQTSDTLVGPRQWIFTVGYKF